MATFSSSESGSNGNMVFAFKTIQFIGGKVMDKETNELFHALIKEMDRM